MTEGGVVSVITPVHPAKAQFLEEAWESLAGQDMPPGWGWQWVVQEDGPDAELADRMPDDERVSYAAGRAGGPAVARTIALARADGDLIKVLDADDVLAPGALTRDIAVLSSNPDVGWTTSRPPNLLPGGSLDPYCCNPEPGRIEQGAFIEAEPAEDYEPPVHPATLCVRRDLLLMVGGWIALPGIGGHGPPAGSQCREPRLLRRRDRTVASAVERTEHRGARPCRRRRTGRANDGRSSLRAGAGPPVRSESIRRFGAGHRSCRFAAEQGCPPVVLVESVEQRPGVVEDLVVGADHG